METINVERNGNQRVQYVIEICLNRPYFETDLYGKKTYYCPTGGDGTWWERHGYDDGDTVIVFRGCKAHIDQVPTRFILSEAYPSML